MVINFDKRECQSLCEIEIRSQQGLSPTSLDYDFRQLEVKTTNESMLVRACIRDAVCFYYSALISFIEACGQLGNKEYSWAAVKLYYTVYYCARAQMGFHKYCTIRKGNQLYTLHVLNGAKPERNQCGNDHKVVLDNYIKFFPTAFILSNKVDDTSFTDYITQIREITHYRQRVMKEPERLDVFDKLNEYLENGKSVTSFLSDCLSDKNIFCFIKNYAYLVTTYVMLQETATQYKSQTNRLSEDQIKYISRLIQKSKIEDFYSDLL